ncbi:MAG: hypothetical protein IPK98_16105 [Chloracidobacterium sp.]|nr:hypothetical protein [Chloracidobacterium sp.]
MDPRNKHYYRPVEERGGRSAHIDGDNTLSKKKIHAQTIATNLWEMTGTKMKDGFQGVSGFIQYFKSVKMDKMGPEDRLVTQSTGSWQGCGGY